MKKLTTSVLAVVLTSTFAMTHAQQKKRDTAVKEQKIEEILFVQPVTGKLKVKDEVTSAQQIISGKELTQASNPNLVSALAGKASSVKILQTDSSVNSTQSIQIRSPRTITGSNEALVVIDNVPSTAANLNSIPGDLIDSINIIKGSAGAAIYGPAGVNGVVVVTTKRGTAGGKMRVKLDSSVGFESIAFMPERQREYGQGWDGDKVNVENGAWGAAYTDPRYAGQWLPYGAGFQDMDGDGIITVDPAGFSISPDDASAVHSTFAPFGKDNVRDFFKTGSVIQNSLTVSSGDSKGYFSLNVSNLERQFIVQDDKLSRYGAFIKGGADFGKLKVSGEFNFSRTKTSTTNSGLYHDLLQSAADIPITKFAAYPDRAYAWNIYYGSPYFAIKHNRYNNNRNYFNVIGSATYSFNKHINLTYRGNVAFTNNEGNSWNDGWNGGTLYNDAMNAVPSWYYENGNNLRTYYGDLLLNFDYDLTKDLSMDLTIGHNYQDSYQKYNQAGGTGIKIPGLYQIWNVASPAQPYTLNNKSYHYNSHSIFATLDLDFRKYLFVNLVARHEMQSKLNNIFVNNTNSFFYPAASFSFVPTKAFNFGGDVISDMKITAAWQRVGSATQVGTYQLYPYAILGSGYPFGGGNGQLSFVSETNPTLANLKPEFITKKEVGLSMAFLKNRISFDAAVYEETTKDLITSQFQSASSGVNYRRMNLGDLRGRGVELSLNLTPIKSNDVRWDLGFNFSNPNTKITKLADGAKEIAIINYSFAGIYAIEGEDFPVIKGTTYKRDDQGRVIVDAVTGLPTVNSQMSVLGRVNPKYILGLNTSLKVKGFTLAATMDYRTGHQFFSGTLQSFTFSGQNVAFAGFDRTQPWIFPNSSILSGGAYVANTTVPVYATTYNNPSSASYNPVSALEQMAGGALYGTVGENFVLDASAFKIREVSIGYTINKNLLAGTGINELSFGLFARNPFTKFAKENKNYDDPETGYGGSASNSGFIGTGATQYPNTKTYGATVSISF